jgi:hypothetical protein
LGDEMAHFGLIRWLILSHGTTQSVFWKLRGLSLVDETAHFGK